MRTSKQALDRRLPWAVLAALVVFASFETAVFAFRRAELPRETEALWSLLFASAWSWWIYVDRRHSNSGYPFEFDALVFFAWPVMVPYYLFRSRSSRSKSPALLIWGLYSLPFLVAGSCYALVSA